MTKRSRLSYLRVMANRSDLTLQGGSNQHDTCKPRDGPLPVNSQRTRRRHPIQHPPTPTPSVAGRNSNYRCKAVHSLPVSATSYFWYVVSTVQSSINTANNGTVLNRHRRRFPFIHSIPKLQLISARSSFLSTQQLLSRP